MFSAHEPHAHLLYLISQRVKSLALEATHPDSENREECLKALFDTLRVNSKNPYLSQFNDKYLRDAENARANTDSFVNNAVLFPTPETWLSRQAYVVAQHMETQLRLFLSHQLANSEESEGFFNLEKLPFKGQGALSAVTLTPCGYEYRMHEKLFSRLGSLGALPSREHQLALLALKAKRIPYEYLIGGFDQRLENQLNLAVSLNSHLVDLLDDDGASLEEYKQRALATLEEVAGGFSEEHQAERFYCEVLKRRIGSLKLCEATSLRTQRLRTLDRINQYISLFPELCFLDFALAVDLCFDEILLLLTPDKKPNPQRERSFQQQQVKISVADFCERFSGARPNFSNFTGSGMQSISLLLARAIFYKQRRQSELLIGVSRFAYYEVFHVIFAIVDPTLSVRKEGVGRVFKTNGRDPCPITKEESTEILDCYIGSFENNVMHDSSGCQFTDLSSIVESQLRLRDESDDPDVSASPFFLLIDNTITPFSDSYLRNLLDTHRDLIHQGSLVVMVANSLNKQFHLGTDKTPLGLMSIYADETRFAEILMQSSYEEEKCSIADMEPSCPTLALATGIMRDSVDLIDQFNQMIRERVRALSQNVISQSLVEAERMISFDSPYSKAPEHLQGEGSANWNFICIRIKHLPDTMILDRTLEESIRDSVINTLKELLEELAIPHRDGFSFSTTTYAPIQNPVRNETVFRLSIGTESIDNLALKMRALVNFSNRVNRLLESPPRSPRFFDSPPLHVRELIKNIKFIKNKCLMDHEHLTPTLSVVASDHFRRCEQITTLRS